MREHLKELKSITAIIHTSRTLTVNQIGFRSAQREVFSPWQRITKTWFAFYCMQLYSKKYLQITCIQTWIHKIYTTQIFTRLNLLYVCNLPATHKQQSCFCVFVSILNFPHLAKNFISCLKIPKPKAKAIITHLKLLQDKEIHVVSLLLNFWSCL